MRQSLNHYVECEISSGYKFDDKKPDAPALRIQFAHFPFKLPDHDEQQNGVPRWLQGHQWMTITKRNIFFHSELCRWVVSAICTAFCWTRNSFSKKHHCHVGACVVVRVFMTICNDAPSHMRLLCQIFDPF